MFLFCFVLFVFCCCFFKQLMGVWKLDQTLFRVFDITSHATELYHLNQPLQADAQSSCLLLVRPGPVRSCCSVCLVYHSILVPIHDQFVIKWPSCHLPPEVSYGCCYVYVLKLLGLQCNYHTLKSRANIKYLIYC